LDRARIERPRLTATLPISIVHASRSSRDQSTKPTNKNKMEGPEESPEERVHKVLGRCFTNATKSNIFEALPQLPEGVTSVTAIATKDLKPHHFGASPDEISGWEHMSKKAVKKAMLDLQWEKLKKEKDRRRLEAAVRSDRAPSDEGSSEGPPPSKRRKLGDDGENGTEEAEAGTAGRILCAPLDPKWLDAAANGVRVVVDCSFDHLMNGGELSSMRSQVSLAIAANEKKNKVKPLRLIVTSLSDTQLLQMAGRGAGGFAQELVARWGADIFSEHFMDVFKAASLKDARERLPALIQAYRASLNTTATTTAASDGSEASSSSSATAAVAAVPLPTFGSTLPIPLVSQQPPITDLSSQLVYLTADSPNLLPEDKPLDPSKVYIVGGIVDKNRHKGLTMDLAKNRYKIETARFPISECGVKMTSSTVLTTNHVVEILSRVEASAGDWKGALEAVIPQRKAASASVAAAGAGKAGDSGSKDDNAKDEEAEVVEQAAKEESGIADDGDEKEQANNDS
jgi:tRNA (Guanine-1)-methyltransferase